MKSERVSIVIVGRGYVAEELLRLSSRHPNIKVMASVTFWVGI